MRELGLLISLIVACTVLTAGTYVYLRSTAGFRLNVERVLHPADPTSLRKLAQGKLIGTSLDAQTQSWLGVPYAQAPLEHLRWRPPQAPRAWVGTRQATRAAPACAQPASPGWGVGRAGELFGSEDCLYLDIHAPKSAAEKGPLPVMLWIHGGGNRVGTPLFTPYLHKLAGSQEVLVVAIQYRLGALGWLYHPAMAANTPEERSGNFGTLDLIASLRWVQGNIAAFGGDPGNVTVFGESAGGRNVFALLSSPLAEGLFHKAISQSGGPIGMWTRAVALNFVDEKGVERGAEPGLERGRWGSSKELALRLLIQAGLATDRRTAKERLAEFSDQELESFLRSRSATEIVRVAARDPLGQPIWYAQNIIDGVVLPDLGTLERFKSPAYYNAVPLITGSNLNEEKLWAVRDPKLVYRRFGLFPQVKDRKQYEKAIRFGSDLWKAAAVDMPADVMSRAGQEVYAYRFDWQDLPQSWFVDYRTLLGAAHATEIPFVFNATAPDDALIPGTYTEANRASREALSSAMSSYWAQFAYTGKPGRGRDGSLPEWRSWQAEQPQYLILDSPEQGGIRLASEVYSEQAIKERLLDKAVELPSNEALCERYAKLFLFSPRGIQRSYQDYRDFGSEGCAAHPPEQWDNLLPVSQ